MVNSVKQLPILSQSARDLDADFAEIEALADQLERLNLDSTRAFAKAQQILARFGECSQRIGGGIQALAQALEQARHNAERAVDLVSSRAAFIQQRQQENDRLVEQFGAIAGEVRKVTEIIDQLRKPDGSKLSPEEKAALPAQLAPLDSVLEKLIGEAHRIKLAARDANLRNLQRDADSLEQSVASARRKLGDLGAHARGDFGMAGETERPRASELN